MGREELLKHLKYFPETGEFVRLSPDGYLGKPCGYFETAEAAHLARLETLQQFHTIYSNGE